MPALRIFFGWIILGAAFLFSCGCATSRSHSFRTVVIDPGHGGHDRGAISEERVYEKDLALITALELETALRKAGIRVVMTRRTDVFIPLGDRVAMANRYPGSLFLSIHYNSAPREGAQGVETFYCRNNSASAAFRIHRSIMERIGTMDRGVKQARFRVLREARYTAVLLECGFLTNRNEARLVQTPAYRKIIVQQITRAVR